MDWFKGGPSHDGCYFRYNPHYIICPGCEIKEHIDIIEVDMKDKTFRCHGIGFGGNGERLEDDWLMGPIEFPPFPDKEGE